MTIDRFGSGTQLYTFIASRVQAHDDTFRTLQPKVDRLPGISGGYSQFGTQPPPAGEGTVTMDYVLVANSVEEITALKDALNQMLWWGEKKLYLKPSNYPTEKERWCMATCVDVSMPVDDKKSQLWQRVKIKWSVPNPFWYATGSNSGPWRWGDGTKWGSGALWGGGGNATQIVAGNNNDLTFSTVGNQPTYPKITLTCATGQLVTGPFTIARMVGDVVVDELELNTSLSEGDSIEINVPANRVLLNGTGAYASLTHNRSYWLKFLPGSNILRLITGDSDDSYTLSIYYYDVYK